MPFETPVLFLIFNRPETTRRVLDVLGKARPSKLFVAADGPRPDGPEDAENCKLARDVVDTADWDCGITRLYRERNLGCRKAVSSAIDWFFQNVEEGIILEDDCLPALSFFDYCRELLERYREDNRVMQICGFNALTVWPRNGHSYYFSNYGPVWGWASWRRAWKYYDVRMELWPEIREKGLIEDFCQNSEEAAFRRVLYDRLCAGEVDTWAYQWGFAKMINHGLSIIPNRNLISNMGFHSGATHTSVGNHPFREMPIHETGSPLKHPNYVIRDRLFDKQYLTTFMPVTTRETWIRRIWNHLRRI